MFVLKDVLSFVFKIASLTPCRKMILPLTKEILASCGSCGIV